MAGLLDDELRYPLFVISISCLYCLLILNFIYVNYSIFLLFISLLLCFIFKFILKNKHFLLVSVSIFFSCVIFLIKFYTKDIIMNSLKGKNLTISGYITEIPTYSNGICVYNFKVENVENVENIPKFKMELISRDDINCELFQKIKIKIKTFENDNITNYARLRSKGMSLSGIVLPYQILTKTGVSKNLKFYVYKIKERLSNFITEVFDPQCAALLKALMLKDRNKINENVKNNFSDSGIYHFLAISGFHFSIIYNMLITIFKLLRFNRRFSYIICCIFLIFFMFMIGFSPSILRSGIMIIIYLLSKLYFKKSNSLNSIGIALIIILLVNPDSCLDIGLWMSFVSSIFIICFSNKFKISKNKNNILLNYILSEIITSLIGTASVLPISILFFKSFSLAFIVTNLLISFQIYLLFILSLIALIFAKLFKLNLFSVFPNFLSKSIILIADIFSNFSIDLDYNFMILCVAFALIILSYSIIFIDIRRNLTSILTIFSIFVMLGIMTYQFKLKDAYNLEIFSFRHKDGVSISNLKEKVNIFESFNNLNNNIFLSLVNDKNIIDHHIYNFLLFDNKIKILTVKINNKIWIKIDIFGETVIICGCGGDVRQLPEIMKKCDIFLAFKLPNNLDMIKFNKIIYLDNSYYCNFNYKKILKYENIVSYGYNMSVLFKNNIYYVYRKA